MLKLLITVETHFKYEFVINHTNVLFISIKFLWCES